MSIADFSNILSIFTGADLEPAKEKELFKEVMLMMLARASSSDANIQEIEVESIRDILQRETGQDFSVADIRTAARSDLYEKVPLRKYLASVSSRLSPDHRATAVRALAEVIRSDTTVSVLEVDFFNMVAVALDPSPAEMIGLTAD